MCGRYTTYSETSDEEFEWILSRADNNSPQAAEYVGASKREVFPSDPAPVIYGRDRAKLNEGGARYGIRYFRWGYPSEKRMIINARAESAAEREMFRASLASRRCVVPTAGFFEWAHSGERIKYRFNLPESDTLYLAGLYRPITSADKRFSDVMQEFVILTTEANTSMAEIHSRMPLILRRDEIDRWIYDDGFTPSILKSTPPELVRRAVNE